MDKIRFKYVGLDLLNAPREERPYYCHFAVYAKDKGATINIVDFYTNKDFEGQFIKNIDYTYQQTSGTCQFSMSRNLSTARRQLRKMALEAIDDPCCRYIDEYVLHFRGKYMDWCYLAFNNEKDLIEKYNKVESDRKLIDTWTIGGYRKANIETIDGKSKVVVMSDE